MSRRVQTVVHIEDDIDGGKADQTIRFAWQGTTYEIDLSNKNAKAFEKAIAPYVDHARRVRGKHSAKPTAGKRTDLADIRKWAQKNGYQVSPRGRLAAEVIQAYDAAR